MKRFALAAALIAILSGILLKGTLWHSLIVLVLGIYLGVPLFLFLAAWLILGLKRNGQIPEGMREVFLPSAIVGGALLLSLGIGSAIHHREIREARNYVASIVPQLDQYRKDHGHYPETLMHFAPSPPTLLQGADGYTADTDYFRFQYWDAAQLMSGFYFSSAARQWIHFD